MLVPFAGWLFGTFVPLTAVPVRSGIPISTHRTRVAHPRAARAPHTAPRTTCTTRRIYHGRAEQQNSAKLTPPASTFSRAIDCVA